MHNIDGGAIARMPAGRVPVSRGEGFGKLLRDTLGRLGSRFGHAHARRMARRDLHRLDDRLLRDIGLRRDQVDEFVDAMFRAEEPVSAKPPRNV